MFHPLYEYIHATLEAVCESGFGNTRNDFHTLTGHNSALTLTHLKIFGMCLRRFYEVM